MLEIRDISKRFEGEGQDPVQALDRVSLTVARGEFVSIVGPSGCGKSTLLEIIAGLTSPTSGVVTCDGQAVEGPHPGVGVVFQEDSTFPWLTVHANIAFGLRAHRLPGAEVARRVAEMVQLVDLEGFESHYPHQLSGGMRQRVAIARTLVTRPEVILMDEPFGALDEQTRLVLGEELLHIWEETGSTIVFVTHSLSEATMLSDRIAVMTARPGRIADIIEVSLPRPRTSDVIGSPVFTEVTGRLWQHLRDEARHLVARKRSEEGAPAQQGAAAPAEAAAGAPGPGARKEAP